MAGRGHSRVHTENLAKVIKRGISKQEVINRVYPYLRKIYERKKREFLKQFNNHPITKEIERGPTARVNLSGTLPGLKYEGGYGGNLFSFIGFNSGDKPIDDLRSAISYNTVLYKKDIRAIAMRGKKRDANVRWSISCKIRYPSIHDLAKITPMPWEPGSWIKKIEKGISGLGYYIWQRQGYNKSRSGMAVQADNQVRVGDFIPKNYYTEIINKTFLQRGR
jgi:hypothetical protein